jgi:hypothetical protein
MSWRILFPGRRRYSKEITLIPPQEPPVMEVARSLSLLALRPVLDRLAPEGGGPPDGANPLAGLDREAAERLTRALGQACSRAWKAVEVILAGPAFWDGCRVFLSPDDYRALHERVGRLRAEALAPEPGRAEEELRKACLAEWHGARKAGLLAGTAPDLPGLVEHAGSLGRAAGDRLSDGERQVAARLAEALRGAGFPNLARLAAPGPAEGVPVLVTAARFFLGQQVEVDPELARRLGWQAGKAAGGREQALAALARTLAAHGRGLQEWLDEEAGAPASRPVHAHAASAAEAAPPQGTPKPAKEGWQGPAAAGPAAPGGAGPAPAAEGPAGAGGRAPLSRRQRFWGIMLPLLALTVPVAAVLWLVYGHAVNEVRQLVGHKAAVTSVAFSPDGKQALTGSGDRTVRLWDVATGAEVLCLEGHAGDVHSVAFAPDGRRAASGGMDSIRLWDLETGKQIRRLDTPTNFVLSVAFSPDGRHVLSTSKADRLVRVWDARTGKQVRQLKGHTAAALAVACSPDGKYVVSGGDTTVRVWDAATGKQLHCFTGHKGPVTSVAFAPDGQYVLSGSKDRTARLWGLESGKEELVFSGHTTAVVAVAFAPDGRNVVTGSLGPTVGSKQEEGSPILAEQHPLRLWDAYSGRESAYFDGEGAQGPVWGVAFSPDGRYLLSSGPERVVRLWQLP